MTPHEYETEVMAHRYLYYVLSDNVISDAEYDPLERIARAVCPADSPVHGVGSSLAGSYNDEQVDRAIELLQAAPAP
jgi:NAD-dependent DNA ligase